MGAESASYYMYTEAIPYGNNVLISTCSCLMVFFLKLSTILFDFQ